MPIDSQEVIIFNKRFADTPNFTVVYGSAALLSGIKTVAADRILTIQS
ncbi:hypothetical protein [Polaromonas sp. UBA4122]|nr:hypothetical protein [Polaromonas sp. UBA4122]